MILSFEIFTIAVKPFKAEHCIQWNPV